MKRVKKLCCLATVTAIMTVSLYGAPLEASGSEVNNTPKALTKEIVQNKDINEKSVETMSMTEVDQSSTTNLAKASKTAATTVVKAVEETKTETESPVQNTVKETETKTKVEEEKTISTTATVENTEKNSVKTNSQSREYFDIPLTNTQQDFIYNKSAELGIPYYIAFGLFEQESNFKTDAVSATNDYGIGQINACHFKNGVDRNRILEFEYNVTVSLGMLKANRDVWDEKYSGSDLDKAMLNSYNMGQYGFKNAGCPLNRAYSNKILKKAEKYK